MAAETFGRLFGLASAYKFRFFLASVTALLSSISAIVPFILIYLLLLELLDKYSSGSPFDQEYIFRFAVASLIAVVLRFSMLGISTALSHIAAYNVLYDLRVQLAQKLGSLSQGYFSSRNTGQIKKVLNEDVENVELFLAHSIPDILSSIFFTPTFFPSTFLFRSVLITWFLKQRMPFSIKSVEMTQREFGS